MLSAIFGIFITLYLLIRVGRDTWAALPPMLCAFVAFLLLLPFYVLGPRDALSAQGGSLALVFFLAVIGFGWGTWALYRFSTEYITFRAALLLGVVDNLLIAIAASGTVMSLANPG